MSGLLKESNPWAADISAEVVVNTSSLVDIRPLAFVDSDGPTVTITQQPANGTATVGGPGFVSVALSEEGADEARYTLTDTRGAVSAPAVLSLTAVSETDPGGGGTDPNPGDEPGSTGEATAIVTNYSQLSAAVASAGPGTIIQLADGTYSGARITISANGTAQSPIVIRGASVGGANVPGAFNVTGDNIIIRGIDFRTSGSASSLRVVANNVQVWRCEFKSYGGDFVRLGTSSGGNRIMYCEFSSTNGSDWTQPTNHCIRSNYGDGMCVGLEVGYCYFHDLPGKPEGSAYASTNRNIMVQGNGSSIATQSTNWWVHHCLAEDCGNCRISCVACDNVYEYCTVTGLTGNQDLTYSTDISIRFGARNIIRGCWLENSEGFLVWDRDNKLISCKAVNARTTVLARADNPAQGGLQYPQTLRPKLSGCELNVLVGGLSWTGNLPVVDARIESHTGSVSLGLETGTVQTGAVTETLVTPIKMLPSQVGPFAP